ncbi:indole-3-pyruvate monooxygenase [Ranunculus cassubicifolius]
MVTEILVAVVGGGPSGIATSACLNRLSIQNILFERENCLASLWKTKTYDRVHLHLAKQFCQLPYMPFPSSYPTYLPKSQFIHYLDSYASHFNVNPSYNRVVESAEFDKVQGKWIIKVTNKKSNEVGIYLAKFLVVATGETCDPYTPNVEGINTFTGEVMHSTLYKSGKPYSNKSVLIVGSGNSGMEIALDLSNYSAKPSVIVRNPIHMVNREMLYMGMVLRKYISIHIIDFILLWMSKFIYGDMTKYGITRLKEGPFVMKEKYGTYPAIDVGTLKRIRSGKIQVLPSIKQIEGNVVEFANEKVYVFDAIVFATGFKRSINKWLKGDRNLLDQDGVPKLSFPDNNWKGHNALYCAGLANRGLHGASSDAQKIADDIQKLV